jgi:hypothetical protein
MSFSKKILKEKNKTQITKSNTINKSNNIFIFIIGIILLLILLYYLTYLYYEYINKKNISKFEDTTTTTTTMMNCIKEPEPPKPTKSPEEINKEAEKAAYGAAGPPNNTKGNTCSLPYDIPSVCMNYEACCYSTTGSNKCFCEHPSVLSCKSTYDTCISNANTKELTDKCNSDIQECCISHNKIPIDSNNFNPPTNQSQVDNIICNARTIKNIETKCLELCQTNKDCAAYSTSPYTCILFNTVSPYLPKTDSEGKPSENTSISFYIKK